ncbi:MAG: RDD family protein [Pyrinomonadaceae bacterium]
MSAQVVRQTSTRSIKPEQIVVNFDAERLKAPFLLRCGAILIDYIILVAIPIISLLIYKYTGREPSKILNNEIFNAGWLIMVLLALTNFVILPLLVGQSIGKMLTGLRVVKKDGKSPSLGSLFIRHLIGYPLTILTFGLGFFISVINSKGRALHDFLAGTVVIYGQKQIVRKDNES